ncbi:MAG: DNA polymerase III subunit gamma/tau [Verrucomicrobiota bacterium]|nr:DNA polymerase III subunit gamma/tau [Verrucomicrobiota bacterium]
MAYQVIARKYRPQRFSEVVGQEHVTRTLANAIAHRRIAHAYLFCGPRGTGKTTIARIFAKCLNATNGPTVDFSDDDPRCREIAEGRSLDVLEIDAASNRGIDEIRGLRETVHYAPAQSRYRIYIIDEVHMLTREAFNALLKTLEEPPEHVKFMFATTEPEKVPATILSRCQRFDLRRIPTALMVRHLATIAHREGVEVEEAALYAIARGADGGLRDAQSTLDQLISFCGQRILESDVLAMYGLTARDQVMALAHAILKGERAEVLRRLDRLIDQGKDPARMLTDLIAHFRNLLIWLLTGGNAELLDLLDAERAALQEQASLISWEGASRIVEVLVDAEARLSDTGSRQILLELALLRAVEMRQAVSIEEVLSELRRMHQQASVNDLPAACAAATSAARSMALPSDPLGVPPASVQSSHSVGSDSSGSERRQAGEPSADSTAPSAPSASISPEPQQVWSALLDHVGRVRPMLRSFLQHGRPMGLEKGRLVIAFPPEWCGQRDLADTPDCREILRTKLRELRAPVHDVAFVVMEMENAKLPVSNPDQAFSTVPMEVTQEPSRNELRTQVQPEEAHQPNRGHRTFPSSSRPGDKLDPTEFKNDPLIQQALERFRARIVQPG